MVYIQSSLTTNLGRHARHVHRQGAHGGLLPKRDRLTITDPKVTTPTELPEVVVYIDQFGSTVRTATETVVYAVPTPPAAPPAESTTKSQSPPQTSSTQPPVVSVEQAPSSPSPVKPAPEPTTSVKPSSSPKQTPSTKPAPPPSPASSVATSASSSPSEPPPTSGGSNLHGVTYSPYKGSGGCKTKQEVDNDFALFAKDHGIIRLYGVDCDQVATAYAAAKKYGNKLFLGIFDISDQALTQAISTIAADLKNDWSIVDTVSVGNELVNNGQVTPAQSLSALDKARTTLRAAGYKGPVVIVDTFVAVLDHPELCEKSDYCAVNVHPFFDGNVPASEAGKFVTSTVSNIRRKLSTDKRIVVTETGWPWQGEANRAAVPGVDQQSKAMSSIKSAYSSKPGDVILFTAFNDMWKKADAGTFMAEQFWGMGGRYSPADK